MNNIAQSDLSAIQNVIYANNNDFIYIDKGNIVIEELDETLNGRRIFLDSTNNLIDRIDTMNELIYDSNMEILKIHQLKSAFTTILTTGITTAFNVSSGNPVTVFKTFISPIGDFLTDNDIAMSVLRTFMSQYFFNEAMKSAKNAKDILVSNSRLSTLDLQKSIGCLIESRCLALAAEHASMREIKNMADVKNMPFIKESLYWAWNIGFDVLENLLFELPGSYAESALKGKHVLISDTKKTIMESINLFTKNLQPYLKSGMDVVGVEQVHIDGILSKSSEIESDVINGINQDTLLDTYIELYEKLGILHSIGVQYI